MRAGIAKIIETAISSARDEGLLLPGPMPEIIVERPKKEEFGDFSTNAAMLLAPIERKKPRDIASILADKIGSSEGVAKCEVAGPGFINMFFERSHWYACLADILDKGMGCGRTDFGKGARINVEFVSANPTGPLHVGHGRGAAVGDTLARVLSEAGYDVEREFYINDTGRQIETLGKSVRARCLEVLGRPSSLPEDAYKGAYVIDVAKEFLDANGADALDLPEQEAISQIGLFAGNRLLERIKKDLVDFRVSFDVWYSEKSLHDLGLVAKAMDELRGGGHLYEDEGATWFRTSALGDDKDRVLVKADGATTYFASDVAYHSDKIRRAYSAIVDVWGADHHGYIPRILALFRAKGAPDESFKVILIQLVALLRAGVPVPMGKREGEFVTLRQVMDEVGIDACRFFFLMRRADAQLDFDLELAKSQAPENPVYYVQYCHARINSIMQFAIDQGIEVPEKFDQKVLSRLEGPEEIELIRHLSLYPETVERSARLMEPHRVAFYLMETAALFHPYYNKNRVVTDDAGLTLARLLLCKAVKTVVASGLGLLGVSAPDKM